MSAYVPPPGEEWERLDPAAAGFDGPKLAAAVAFAQAYESTWPRSMVLADGRYIGTADLGEEPPFDEVLGQVRPRGAAGGVLLRGGRIVAEWGDPFRPDMTFSIAKSYLALLAGIAVGYGLIGSIDDSVRDAAPDTGFDSAQNRAVTWRHLLQQTSEWEGTLWGKPDLIDRNRHAGPGQGTRPKGTHRELGAPGSCWEYNDVRVNRLSLSLMQVFRRPLPEVLRAAIMDPIGASPTWEWHGYRNSRVVIDGREMESVSGGAHWGGGLFISTRDHARLALLVHRGGSWGGHRLLAPEWIEAVRTPCELNRIYGLLWWLNTDQGLYSAAPASSVFAIGMGTNLIWLDPDHDLVAVVRWMAKDKVNAWIAGVLESLSAA